ncbi:MAG: hypothetical protein J0I41_18100 [Filimonas sp.]|nr:hypothetical protein [Filimonas sp.]
MKKILLLLIIAAGFAACGGNDKVSKKLDDKAYKEQKDGLAEKERRSPLAFLTVTSSDRRNIWGQTVVKGEIRNTASICSYKDVRLKLLYYGKEGKQVANHEDVYEDVIAPGGSNRFKAKFKTPRGTDSVAVSIMSAVVVK